VNHAMDKVRHYISANPVNIARRWIPSPIWRWLRRLLRGSTHSSASYSVIDSPEEVSAGIGWTDPLVALRQHESFVPLIEELRKGRPREDFVALANAVRTTGATNPRILELGCGSGWNYLVLQLLWGEHFGYTGLDISAGMIDLAKHSYPLAIFVVGDATNTPFRDGEADVVISGTLLMHQPDYSAAIRECRRLAANWCVFHTVPVMRHRPTTYLKKLAYGQPTVELVFNEEHLRSEFVKAKFDVVGSWESLGYNLRPVLGEPTHTRTYLCRSIK
jgi:SAM-dependent methyltransferase